MSDKDLITFDNEKVALIKRTVAEKATDTELELFLHQCRRTGLDPLAKQIYFQKYNTKRGPQVAFITGIDGYRLIADRTGQYAGSDEPVFEGTITEQTLGYTETGPPIPEKCTMTIYKMVNGVARPFTSTSYWVEYYPGYHLGHMWRKMPHVMLAKVTEAQALRKGFPADLSGVYTREEMEQAYDDDVPTTVKPEVDIPKELENKVKIDNAGVDQSDAVPEDIVDGEVEEVPPLADDELVIYEVNPESPGDYMATLISLIDRYDNSYAVKNALKKLGFTGLKTKPIDRVEQYRALRDHAKARDTEEEE